MTVLNVIRVFSDPPPLVEVAYICTLYLYVYINNNPNDYVWLWRGIMFIPQRIISRLQLPSDLYCVLVYFSSLFWFSLTGLIIVDISHIRQINPLYNIYTEPSSWTSGRDQNGATRRENTGLQFVQPKLLPIITTTNYKLFMCMWETEQQLICYQKRVQLQHQFIF